MASGICVVGGGFGVLCDPPEVMIGLKRGVTGIFNSYFILQLRDHFQCFTLLILSQT